MLNQVIWKDKKVLVTGHTGFKGSWLSIWLKMMGAKVIGYALEPYTDRDNFVLTKLEEKITHIIGDVRDYQKLYDVFIKYEPEFVFHLAAQPIVRESYLNPKETFDVNIGGIVNLLECCRLTESIKVIVNVTTDKCYENKELIRGYQENDRLGGYDPYSSSKAGSEIVTAAYRQSFFNPKKVNEHGKNIASARAGNVIGGGAWHEDRDRSRCRPAFRLSIRHTVPESPLTAETVEKLGYYMPLTSIKMMAALPSKEDTNG